jgi:hydroxymethylpyrimidine kinase/phosphomethylpyrimidine kinase/thiamine-phosphate diphosphorylase
MKKKTTPLIWSIAGSDSSSGAGMQADLLAAHALGIHACSIVTALTAQSPAQVFATEAVSEAMLCAQFKAAKTTGNPAAVKTGMLRNGAIVRAVANRLAKLDSFIVCDPVLVSSSGNPLFDERDIPVLIRDLLPRVNLLTPNLSEAALLSGLPIKDLNDTIRAAQCLLELGPEAVLIKGGHGRDAVCSDYYCDQTGRHFWLNSLRIPGGHTVHGTGCALSSALAAGIALGYLPHDAVTLARAFINRAIRNARPLGSEYQALCLDGWPDNPRDLPWACDTPNSPRLEVPFPDCGTRPLGIYPLVDSAEWVERLIAHGVNTIQLRLKKQAPDAINREIARATGAANRANCRLFINDYWQAAIQHNAYGVHLGQEDLDGADLHAIQRAGLRLGTSTHGFYELARVNTWRPSYAAMGTVFPSPSKPGLKRHLGLPTLARMTALSEAPAVAIGGILLENAFHVVRQGISGIAVISDVKNAANLKKHLEAWQKLFCNHP